jgi:integrase
MKMRIPRGHLKKCKACSAEKWLRGEGLCEEGKALHAQTLADAGKVTLYSLRHTAASILLEGGVHIKAVSERLGHASTAFRMDTYVHSLPTVQEQAAETLNLLVFGRKKA